MLFLPFIFLALNLKVLLSSIVAPKIKPHPCPLSSVQPPFPWTPQPTQGPHQHTGLLIGAQFEPLQQPEFTHFGLVICVFDIKYLPFPSKTSLKELCLQESGSITTQERRECCPEKVISSPHQRNHHRCHLLRLFLEVQIHL